MAMGIPHPVLGAITFSAIKFIGYVHAARALNWHYKEWDRSSWFVGGIRALVGLGGGTAYALCSLAVSLRGSEAGDLAFVAGLAVVRLIEWTFIIWLFYDRDFEYRRRAVVIVILATLWSFLLDLPAVFGFVQLSEFFMC
jgi:hypothetical protein